MSAGIAVLTLGVSSCEIRLGSGAPGPTPTTSGRPAIVLPTPPPSPASTAAPAPTTFSTPGTWSVFTSTAAGFSIVGPLPVTQDTKRVDLTNGGGSSVAVDLHQFAFASPIFSFEVAYFDLPPGLYESEHDALDAEVRSFLEGGEVDERKAVMSEGIPCRDVRVRIPARGFFAGRICLAGIRMYQVSAGSVRAYEIDRKYVDAFRYSFRVLNTPTP